MSNFLSFDFEQTALICLIVIKVMWSFFNCCGAVDFFLSVPHYPFHLFWNNLWIVRIDSIPSSSRFVINGWYCRQCVQGMLNRSGHTIVDDEFLFVKDSLIRLWEHRIRGSHSPIHMISDSWTTQKEHVQKDVWNISIISMYGLVHYHQKYKANFCRIPCNQRYKHPLTTPTILFGVHWPHQWRRQC